eukprot:Hpha_TRINITY_DN30906_c0_g1::TRINITY_DN30906_c0_g1_i1::g.112367::m.112367
MPSQAVPHRVPLVSTARPPSSVGSSTAGRFPGTPDRDPLGTFSFGDAEEVRVERVAESYQDTEEHYGEEEDEPDFFVDGVEFLAPSGDAVRYAPAIVGLQCHVSTGDTGDWADLGLVRTLNFNVAAGGTLCDARGVGGLLPVQGRADLLSVLATLADFHGVHHNIREEALLTETELLRRPSVPVPLFSWGQAAEQGFSADGRICSNSLDSEHVEGRTAVANTASSSSSTFCSGQGFSGYGQNIPVRPAPERYEAGDGVVAGPLVPLFWHRQPPNDKQKPNKSVVRPPSSALWDTQLEQDMEAPENNATTAFVPMDGGQRLGLLFVDERRALLVRGVTPGSPAEWAGLARFKGRLLIKVDGYELQSISDARNKVLGHNHLAGPLELTFAPKRRGRSPEIILGPAGLEGMQITRPLGPPRELHRRKGYLGPQPRMGHSAPFSQFPPDEGSPPPRLRKRAPKIMHPPIVRLPLFPQGSTVPSHLRGEELKRQVSGISNTGSVYVGEDEAVGV